MEELNEKLYIKILDFDSTRKEEWLKERKAYAALFELTPRCNFNCLHCYLQNSHNQDMLTTEQVKKILDILCDKGILFLTLTGGEILTRPDFCEIYLYAKKKGFFVELFSNGYLLNNELINVFKEYPPLLVSISIYGACDETYYKVTGVKNGFSRVYDNCKKMVEAGIRVSLKSPIISITENEMHQMEMLAREIGLTMIFSFEIHNAIDGSNIPLQYRTSLKSALKYEFSEFLENKKINDNQEIETNTIHLQKDKHIFTCNVATNSFAIDYRGNLLPCMKFRHKGISLLDNSFEDIWEQFKIYKELKVSENYVCKKCDSVYFCDVCPAEMEFVYGDMEYRDCNNCKAAKIRKAFYKGEISYDEALQMADL